MIYAYTTSKILIRLNIVTYITGQTCFTRKKLFVQSLPKKVKRQKKC